MAAASNKVTAALLIIGDEILSGRTQDANLSALALWLNGEGIGLGEARVVPDDEAMIVTALNELRRNYAYVFTTGGIGPTHDDITVDCVAKAFAVSVVHHPEAVARLKAYYKERVTESRLRMARVPKGASLIENPVSIAPGIRMENVMILAGIPNVMRGMLEGLTGKLKGGRPVLSRTVAVIAPESAIADRLGAIQAAHKDVTIGSYPVYRDGRYAANLVIRSPDAESVDKVAAEILSALAADGHEMIDGEISAR